MRHRSMSVRMCIGLATLGLLAVAPQVSAQENATPILYTYVAQWNVPRARWGDMQKFAQSAKATLDKLVDDGTLTAYGFADVVIHTEDGPTHEEWMQATSVGSILRAVDAMRESTTSSPVLASARHDDIFLRSTIYGNKPGTYEHGYLWVGSFAIKPGHVEDWSRNFKTYMAPELAKLVDDGTLAAYQLDTELVHEGDPNTLDYAFVTTHPDGIDRVQAMIRRIEGKDPAIGAAFDSWEQDKGHSDSIALVLMMRAK